MGVLAWLGAPVGATALAILWVQWANRTRGPVETNRSLAERERFKAALTPSDQRRRRVS
ncbi:MAG TPA: hypothetical protein VME70_14320 [Mycobacteriales bacterium]|nr:hypothetical protein [Mycobacteriales bacterium]